MANRGEGALLFPALMSARRQFHKASRIATKRQIVHLEYYRVLLQISPSPFPANLGEVRNGAELLEEFRQEAEAILAHGFIVGHY